jgi:hypothetical protein
LIAFVLVFAGLRGLGPFDKNHPLAKLLGLSEPVQIADSKVGTPEPATPRTESLERRQSMSERNVEARDTAERDPAEVESVGPNMANDPVVDGAQNDESALDASEPGRPTNEEAQNGVVENPSTASEELVLEAPAVPSDETVVDTPPGESDASVPPADVRDENTAEPELTAEPRPDTDAGADSAEPAATDVVPTEARAVPPEPLPIVDPIEARQAAAKDSEAQPVPTFSRNLNSAEGVGELGDNVTTDEAATAEQAAETPVEVQPVAQLLSDAQVVVVRTGATDSWQRADVNRPIMPGDEIMALPLFRPQIALANGLQVTLAGMSHLLVEQPASGVPRLNLKSGRALVVATQPTGLKLGLQFGTRRGELNLADAQSVLAVEFERIHVPGTNPEQQPAHYLLHVFVTSGKASWIEEGKSAADILPGQSLTIFDDREPLIDEAGQLPEWINGTPARPRDPIATQQLAPRIVVDRPVELSLREQADSRFQEVRSLAACSLGYLGKLDPIVAALNDESMKAYWTEQVEALRTIIALDPTAAVRVREAFTKRHNIDADQIYRMLWGYTPDELKAGEDDVLIDTLNHESLDFRVVAIETLKSITGKDRTLYSPEKESERSRRSGMAFWRELARRDGIEYKEIPEILNLTSAN